MILDQPPHLILPDHWQARRPAIIRPVDAELRRAMPVLPGALIRRQPAPATLAFTYGAAVVSSAASYSFGSVGYGTAAANRTLIAVAGMMCAGSSTAVISSVTVDGVAMTQRLTIGDTYLGAANNCTFFTLPKPSGASGTIVVASSYSPTAYWALSLYAVYGLLSEVPTASLSDKTATGTFNGSLAVSDGGIIIGGMNGRLSTNVTGTSSWTGLTPNGNQTEQGGQVFKQAVASQAFASGGTKSVGVTFGGGTVNSQATMFGAFR